MLIFTLLILSSFLADEDSKAFRPLLLLDRTLTSLLLLFTTPISLQGIISSFSLMYLILCSSQIFCAKSFSSISSMKRVFSPFSFFSIKSFSYNLIFCFTLCLCLTQSINSLFWGICIASLSSFSLLFFESSSIRVRMSLSNSVDSSPNKSSPISTKI